MRHDRRSDASRACHNVRWTRSGADSADSLRLAKVGSPERRGCFGVEKTAGYSILNNLQDRRNAWGYSPLELLDWIVPKFMA